MHTHTSCTCTCMIKNKPQYLPLAPVWCWVLLNNPLPAAHMCFAVSPTWSSVHSMLVLVSSVGQHHLKTEGIVIPQYKDKNQGSLCIINE